MTHESTTIQIVGFLTQLSKIRVIYLALSITQEWKQFCQSRIRARIVCEVMSLHALIIRSCKFRSFSLMLYCVYLISLRLQTNTAQYLSGNFTRGLPDRPWAMQQCIIIEVLLSFILFFFFDKCTSRHRNDEVSY